MLDREEECQRNRRMGRHVEVKESQNIRKSIRGTVCLCICMYHGYHLLLKRGVEAVEGKCHFRVRYSPKCRSWSDCYLKVAQ